MHSFRQELLPDLKDFVDGLDEEGGGGAIVDFGGETDFSAFEVGDVEEAGGAVGAPVVWNMVAERAVPLVIWWSFVALK